MSPNSPDATTAQQALSDADGLGKQLDDVLEEVLVYLAGALSTTGEKASFDLSQTKALITGEVKYLAGQIDPQLTAVVDNIYATIQFLDTMSQQQADQLVLLLQQLQQKAIPGQPPLKVISNIPPGGQPIPPTGQPTYPYPVSGFPPQSAHPSTMPIPPQPLPVSSPTPLPLPVSSPAPLPPGVPPIPPPAAPRINPRPPIAPTPIAPLPPVPIPPPGTPPVILPVPPPGSPPQPITVPPPPNYPGEPPQVPPSPIGYTPTGEPIYPQSSAQAPEPTQAPSSVAPQSPDDVSTITQKNGNVTVTVNLPPPEVIIEQSPGVLGSLAQSQSQTGPTVNVADESGEKLPKTALAPPAAQQPPGAAPAQAEKPPPQFPVRPPAHADHPCGATMAGTPRIGSPEWCVAMAAIMDGARAVGKLVMAQFGFAAVGFSNVSDVPPDWFKDTAGQLPLGIGAFLQSTWTGSVDTFNLGTLILKCIYDATTTMMRAVSCDDPELTIALVMLRAGIQSFKRFRVGTDAGLWATLDISLTWTQAEAAVDYLINASCPYKIPSEGQSMETFRKERIGRGQYDCWMEMNGYDPGVFDPVLLASRPVPTFGHRQEMLWRLRDDKPNPGLIYTPNQFRDDLNHDGYVDAWKDRLNAIRYRVKVLRELRQLLDADKATHDDVQQSLRDYGYDKDDAALLADMEVIETDRRKVAETQGWTVSRILHCFRRGVIDATTAEALFTKLHWGHDYAVMSLSAEITVQNADLAQTWANTARSTLAATVERGYKEGLLTQAAAINTMEAAGALPDTARSLTLSWSTEINLDQRKQAMSAIRKGWESGYVSDASAVQMLIGAGYLGDFASTTVRNWRTMRGYDETILSGQQVLAALAKGDISGPAALLRLQGMGWEIHDAEILIAEAGNALTKAEEVAATKSEASAKRASDQAAKLAKQADAAKRLAVTALRKETPLGTMKSLLRKGLISEDKFISRMKLMEYDDAAIALAIADVCSAKSAACVQSDGPADATVPDGSAAPSGDGKASG